MNRTQQTLVEQMKISDIEINRRMELLNITDEDFKLLTSQNAYVQENIEVIVDEFYEVQTKIDEISLLIGDAETLQRLKFAQKQYILDLFSGHYDSDYVNNRLRIGMVHKRIGVDPKLYLSAVYTMKSIINKHLKKHNKKNDNFPLLTETLDKLFYFDITLVFDTYIDSLIGEIETAKQRTEVYALSLEAKVLQRTKELEELARIDSLTNIYNKRAMLELLRRELIVAKRNESTLSFVYFDIDKFKHINDAEGHLKGDEVLASIGQILLNEIREVDIPCRYGGDEFCIILPNCKSINAKEICKKIIKRFTQKYENYSLSVGITETGNLNSLDSSTLIKQTDEKMYIAKQTEGSKIIT